MSEPLFTFALSPLRGPTRGHSWTADKGFCWVAWDMMDSARPYLNVVRLHPAPYDGARDFEPALGQHLQAAVKAGFGGVVVTYLFARPCASAGALAEAIQRGAAAGDPQGWDALMAWGRHARAVLCDWQGPHRPPVFGAGDRAALLVDALAGHTVLYALPCGPMLPGITELPRMG